MKQKRSSRHLNPTASYSNRKEVRMKRILAKGAVVLVISLFTFGAAQEATPPKGDGMAMGQGSMRQHNMNQGTMGEQQGMMAMMQMMEACSSMMQAMQGE